MLERNQFFLFLIFYSSFSYGKTFFVSNQIHIGSRIEKNASKRAPSFPYITGDTFREYADFIFDETKVPLDTNKIHPGDIVFVNTYYLDDFLQRVYPHIIVSFIILTHNSDIGITKRYKKFLDDDKIIAWFGQNVFFTHKKLFPVPIGIPNRYWGSPDSHQYMPGNLNLLERIINRQLQKKKLLYVNLGMTNTDRIELLKTMKTKPFCYIQNKKKWDRYLEDLAQSKFVLSPEGNGLDCHRTWEAMLLNAIPVVKSSTLDALFEDLPVLIIEDWDEITEKFLCEKNEEFTKKEYTMSKLYIHYWFEKIEQIKKNKL